MFFFFNDTATTEIYTLSLHDALPILLESGRVVVAMPGAPAARAGINGSDAVMRINGIPIADIQRLKQLDAAVHTGNVLTYRSEEHTSELQSRLHLVCRLLLEKKKNIL